MSNEIFSPEEKENFHNAFNAFDEHRDGKISPDLLGKLLRAVGFNPYPEEVEDMIEDACPRGGLLSFDTFLYLLSAHAKAAEPEVELVAAFRVFDKQGTGRLPVETIQKILRSIKRPFTDDQIAELLASADVDAQQSVDYADFVKLILDF
jgi:Ca2+-binding EF-hand superfamily protein